MLIAVARPCPRGRSYMLQVICYIVYEWERTGQHCVLAFILYLFVDISGGRSLSGTADRTMSMISTQQKSTVQFEVLHTLGRLLRLSTASSVTLSSSPMSIITFFPSSSKICSGATPFGSATFTANMSMVNSVPLGIAVFATTDLPSYREKGGLVMTFSTLTTNMCTILPHCILFTTVVPVCKCECVFPHLVVAGHLTGQHLFDAVA